MELSVQSPFLETERLLIRPFTWDDWDLVLAFASDPGTTRYLYSWAHPGVTPEMDARRFLGSAVEAWREDPVTYREYVLILKETGEAIGEGSIELVAPDTSELGWILLPQARGRGYIHEMALRLIRFGLETLHTPHIIAHCDARNTPSWHVMGKLGMKLEQLAPGARPLKDGIRGDEMTWGMRFDLPDCDKSMP